MDKGVRNTILTILGTFAMMFLGAWIQINSRISVLEIEVNNDKQLYYDSQAKLEKMVDKVNDIQIKVTRLSTIVEGKGKKNEDD